MIIPPPFPLKHTKASGELYGPHEDFHRRGEPKNGARSLRSAAYWQNGRAVVSRGNGNGGLLRTRTARLRVVCTDLCSRLLVIVFCETPVFRRRYQHFHFSISRPLMLIYISPGVANKRMLYHRGGVRSVDARGTAHATVGCSEFVWRQRDGHEAVMKPRISTLDGHCTECVFGLTDAVDPTRIYGPVRLSTAALGHTLLLRTGCMVLVGHRFDVCLVRLRFVGGHDSVLAPDLACATAHAQKQTRWRDFRVTLVTPEELQHCAATHMKPQRAPKPKDTPACASHPQSYPADAQVPRRQRGGIHSIKHHSKEIH